MHEWDDASRAEAAKKSWKETNWVSRIFSYLIFVFFSITQLWCSGESDCYSAETKSGPICSPISLFVLADAKSKDRVDNDHCAIILCATVNSISFPFQCGSSGELLISLSPGKKSEIVFYSHIAIWTQRSDRKTKTKLINMQWTEWTFCFCFSSFIFSSPSERLPAYLLLLFEQFNEDLTFTRRVIKGDFNNPFALPSLRVARFDLCTQMGIRMRAQPNFQRPTTMGR